MSHTERRCSWVRNAWVRQGRTPGGGHGGLGPMAAW